jgi:phospholipid/cholesterol/gamma-HCH transport system permease protein
VLSGTIGIMLALQGIDGLRKFGAQDQVVFGVALGITREFAPLITGILVAGRSGSALAARLATMTISQEVDALRSMGVDPVRFLVVPALLAMVVMVPALVIMADLVGLFGAGLYIAPEIDITMTTYMNQVIDSISSDDVFHGLAKSAIFGVLITIVGIVDGSSVTGGAEGVGRVTTSSVVHGISAIILTDMIFVFAATR